MKISLISRLRRALSPRRWVRKPLLFGAVVALLMGLGGGAAFAYFSPSGSGSGATSVGTPQSVTVVEASGTVTNKLYPGASGDLLVELDNPNSYSVNIVGITGNGTVTGTGTCSNSGVTVNTNDALNISVAPGNNVSVVIPNGVSMAATSDSGCQGNTFQVPVTITVQK